jgi:hypothetical protein
MHLRLLFIFAVAAMLINSRACGCGGKEGWRPFAWYGYPGVKPGQMGYQARGDWCGIVPGTTTQDKPLPLVPFKACSRNQQK